MSFETQTTCKIKFTEIFTNYIHKLHSQTTFKTLVNISMLIILDGAIYLQVLKSHIYIAFQNPAFLA